MGKLEWKRFIVLLNLDINRIFKSFAKISLLGAIKGTEDGPNAEAWKDETTTTRFAKVKYKSVSIVEEGTGFQVDASL